MILRLIIDSRAIRDYMYRNYDIHLWLGKTDDRNLTVKLMKKGAFLMQKKKTDKSTNLITSKNH